MKVYEIESSYYESGWTWRTIVGRYLHESMALDELDILNTKYFNTDISHVIHIIEIDVREEWVCYVLLNTCFGIRLGGILLGGGMNYSTKRCVPSTTSLTLSRNLKNTPKTLLVKMPCSKYDMGIK